MRGHKFRRHCRPFSWLVVMLYYIEGFKTSEISQILDIPEGTVRSRLARGREQLAGLLQLKVVN